MDWLPRFQQPSPTLPQPDFPGFNAIAAGAGEGLDPHFRPNVIDSFDFTIQRQLGRRLTMELGYIGRRITHEYQPINVNAVPYMMTLGGQQFKGAYAALMTQYGRPDFKLRRRLRGLDSFRRGAQSGLHRISSKLADPAPFFSTR